MEGDREDTGNSGDPGMLEGGCNTVLLAPCKSACWVPSWRFGLSGLIGAGGGWGGVVG